MKKEILIITENDFVKYPNEFRVHHQVEYLIKNKFNVTVLYWMSLIKHILFKYSLQIDIKEDPYCRIIGIRPVWLANYFPIVSAFLIFIRYSLFEKKHYELCIAHCPFAGIIGLLLRKINRIDFLVYDDWDFFPDFHNKGIYRRLVEFAECKSVQHSDMVVCCGYELQALRKKQGAKNCYVITNGVNYSLFSKVQHKRLENPKKIRNVMVYMGSIEEWAGLDLPIRAMPKIKEKIPDIKFIILGDGPDKNNLEKLKRDLKLENNLLFLGKKKYEELPDFLIDADIGIATFKPSDLMKYAFTLKVIEYMAAGLPVIATSIGETKRIIEDSKAGKAISYSENEFIESILEILLDTKKYEKYAQNAVIYSKQFDWDELFKKEFEIINELMYDRSTG